MPDANMPDQGVLASLGTPGGISALLSIFKGSPGSTSTQTTTDNVSLAKQQAILEKDLIGGTGGIPGLAAISTGQKNAGMYNSTVNQLLTNSLLSKSAADVAALSSSKTTTGSIQGNPQIGKTGIATSIGALLAGTLLNKVAGSAIGSAGNALGAALGLGSGAVAGSDLLSSAGATPEALAAAGTAANSTADMLAKAKANSQDIIANNYDESDPNASINNAIAIANQKKKNEDGTPDISDVVTPDGGGTGNLASGGNVVTAMQSASTPADSAAVLNVVNSTATNLASGIGGLDTTLPATTDGTQSVVSAVNNPTGFGSGGAYTETDWNAMTSAQQTAAQNAYEASQTGMNMNTISGNTITIKNTTPGSTGDITNPYTSAVPNGNGAVPGSTSGGNGTNINISGSTGANTGGDTGGDNGGYIGVISGSGQ